MMRVARKATCLAALLCLVSCYEDLPPVEHPQNVEAVGVSFNVAGDGLVFIDSKGAPVGNVGALQVSVTNLYKEYVVDDEQIEVEIRMYMKGFPERSVAVTLSSKDLVTSGALSHGVLAIAPRQAIRVETQWSHCTQKGESFLVWGVHDTPGGVIVPRASGKPVLAYPVTFMVQASIKVFKSRPTEFYPADRKTYREFALYYAQQ